MIAFMAEYDALPEIGSRMWRNIIAAAAVGAVWGSVQSWINARGLSG